MNVFENKPHELPNWNILNTIKERMVIKYNWEEKKVDDAIEEYKKFIFIIKYGGDDIYSSPPGLVDDIWHEHILFTYQYAIDTNEYLGKMLHHYPSDIKMNKAYQVEEYGKIYDIYFGERKFLKMFKKFDGEHCTYGCDLDNCCCSQK